MTQLRLNILLCQLAERDHAKSRRQYAHVFHEDNDICICAAFWLLPANHLYAILAHEIGHTLAGERATEARADAAFLEVYGLNISYKSSEHGKLLQWFGSSQCDRFAHIFRVDVEESLIEASR